MSTVVFAPLFTRSQPYWKMLVLAEESHPSATRTIWLFTRCHRVGSANRILIAKAIAIYTWLFVKVLSCSVLYAEETSARAVRFSILPLNWIQRIPLFAPYLSPPGIHFRISISCSSASTSPESPTYIFGINAHGNLRSPMTIINDLILSIKWS